MRPFDDRRFYTGVGIAGAVVAANAFRPISRRSGYAAGPIWASAWTATEVPRLSAAVEAGLLAAGLPRRRAGALALGMGTASIAAHLRLHQVSRRSHTTLDRALDEALGPDSRTAGSSADAPRLQPRAARRRYIRPAEHALVYADTGPRGKLDIWRHPDLPDDAGSPVVIQVHGGAWATGDNRMQAAPLLTRLVEHGWVCVAPNYRLSPKHRWPAHIVDVNRAIAWTKDNIARYGGDPGFIALTGGSAGGHLTSLAALAPDHAPFKPGLLDVDTTVQAVVPYYGAYDWLDRDGTANPYTQEFVRDKVLPEGLDEDEIFAQLEHGSPRSWVGDHAPPFFVLHGQNDAMLPVEQARSFVAALQGASAAPVAYAELPLAQHAFDLTNSPRARQTAAAVERFLSAALDRHRSRTDTLTPLPADTANAVAGTR